MEFSQATAFALVRVGAPSTLVLKKEQVSAVRAVYEGRDVFVWLPTGFGKSICYELLPFVFDHKLGRIEGTNIYSLVIVVTPLVSLMVDQVTDLKKRGVDAAIISGSDRIEKSHLATEQKLKDYRVLFTVPEAILGHKWRDCIEKPDISNRIVAIVVDEAHCVSKW